MRTLIVCFLLFTNVSFSQDNSVHQVSNYKFLLGGTWTHSDKEVTEGIFNAAVYFRTRFLGDESNNTFFTDFLVNADFITNQPFNSIKLSNPASIDTATDIFLKSVSSSQITLGLYECLLPNLFADSGAFGLVQRFSISTQKGSTDIFRRFIFGVRLENRSHSIISGSAIEIGFTGNKIAGSLESKMAMGFKRVLIDMELPIIRENNGFFMQFHSEWPLGKKERIAVASGGSKKLAPPVYQFKLGMLVDPEKIIGRMFSK